MKNIVLALAACSSLALYAQSPKDCANINNNENRLACYDAIFNPPKGAESKSEKREKKAVKEQLKEAKRADKKARSDEKILVSKADLFGKESSMAGLTDDSMESRAVGSFKRWQKKMKIKLENGQVWQVTSNNTMYYKIENPKVKIEKGALGAFYMGIEGVNRRLKVKRIK